LNHYFLRFTIHSNCEWQESKDEDDDDGGDAEKMQI
jgi:hypothetical protein